MTNKLPDYIENILDEWETIAHFAYDNYEKLGRGSTIVFTEDNQLKFMYSKQEWLYATNNDVAVKLCKDYNPEIEFLVTFEENQRLRTIRIASPEEESNPKRIWFFNTLADLNDNPDFDMESLPDWFLNTLDKLSSIAEKK